MKKGLRILLGGFTAWFFIWLPASAGLMTAGGCGGGGGGGGDATVAADAGDDTEVLVGTAATLDGNGSTGVSRAAWSFTSVPSGSAAALSSEDTLTPSFTPDVAGEYVVELSINNGASTDSVTLTAQNVVSAITAGSGISTRTRLGVEEFVVNSGVAASLSGASSAAALTAKNAAVSSYLWEQISGPNATASGNTSATLEFTAPGYGEIQDLNRADNYKWQPLPISRDDTKMVFRLTTTSSGGDSDVSTFTLYLQDTDGTEIHPSSGLSNVAVGSKIVLSGPDLLASGASSTDTTKEFGSAVTDWSWTLSVPSGSSAVFADSGATTSTSQFPQFTPDAAGLYIVTYTSTTGTNTYTSPTRKCPGSLTINAADWSGVGTVGGTSPVSPQCGTCHGSIGGAALNALAGLDDMVTEWGETVHASIFENNMETYAGSGPEPFLWQYHTVGFNTDASNSGFDDLVADEAFEFPSTGLTFSEFASAHPDLAKLSNVQCENCHGPGSQHAGDPLRVSLSFTQAGVCGQCHQEETQWISSGHDFVGVEHGSGNYQNSWSGSSAGCLRCHNSKGFEVFVEEGEEELLAIASTFLTNPTADFPGVTCAGCHDPHNATNDAQLRLAGELTMAIDDSTVDAGNAAVCYTCHDGNYAKGETNCDVNGSGTATADDDDARAGVETVDGKCETKDGTAIGYWRGGMHYVTQGPMLEGKQAVTDLNHDGTTDLTLDENSFHSTSSFTLAAATGNTSLSSENNKCVTCHMAEGPGPEEEGYGHIGGHTFSVVTGHPIGHLQGTDEGDILPEEEGDIENLAACTVCHASISEANGGFNRTARADYDGDGTREGVQDEVKGLIYNLWTLMKVIDTATGGNMNQASSSCTAGATTSSNTTVGPTSTSDASGDVTVDSVAWKGCCSSFSSSNTVCGKSSGSCTNVNAARTKDDYQQCNFIEAPEYLRSAVWNFNSIVREGSLGIHNAAYTIQVLQETYKALGRLSLLNKSGTAASATTFTYQTDYANATLR